ncbi:MAG: type ISP restriction/modification enzyme, partial [Candidatus Electryoneaceae bacterium]|nr:type ISP restriction/modification enzyme [Candidatus Electryoneaceae bacterium]
MTPQTTRKVKPSHAVIQNYYRELEQFTKQGATGELTIRPAFQHLLENVAGKHGLTLLTELSDISGTSTIRPDGTVRDRNYIPRGHWEAKGPSVNIDAAISQKKAAGYPVTNIIFENSRVGVLYQNGHETYRADLTDPKQLAELMNLFYGYEEPHYQEFDKAVAVFKDRVPELARGLNEKIKEAHQNNPAFQKAFDSFYRLCQNSLNPNLSRDAVDEMIIQHLLTERLIRRIFDNSDFTGRNVIASEVEKVINAMTSKSFSRQEYLQGLDRFYIAIENVVARSVTDFEERMRILNNVYEQFFQGYSIKVADTHGIVYTPQPIVDFMCASVVEALDREFGKSLGDPDVVVLDPCTGTGSFIVNLLRRVPKQHLEYFYKNCLFANEVMLMPYYIASLSIEHTYYELTGSYEPFRGLCFVDTLDMVKGKQTDMFLTEANTERIERQRESDITIIIGNPPYNVGQQNENDNNKNRKYVNVEKRIRETYSKDSTATNKNSLMDAYVKFFRWATDRLNGRDGIVCFVSNNSFIDNIAFDGMRKHLLHDFTSIHHVDLHGNVRQNPKLSGTTHNVFGIQVGVGITVAIKSEKREVGGLYYHRVPEFWRKEEKLGWLSERTSYRNADLEKLTPNARYSWLVSEQDELFQTFIPLGTKEAKRKRQMDAGVVFLIYGRGVATCRDAIVYDFNREKLIARLKEQIEAYNGEVDRYKRAKDKSNVDGFVKYDVVNWSRDLKQDMKRGRYAEFNNSKIRISLYRPFIKRHLFFDRIMNEEVYLFPIIFPTPATEQENRVICVSGIGSNKPFQTLITSYIPCLDILEKSL